MLKLQSVTKTYTSKGVEVKALDGVSITFPASGLVFISGKSGCGKTTLLNVIGGLDGIEQGDIFVQDKNFSEFSPIEYDAYRNTFVGFIFQDYNLLPEFTVEKNIRIAMELQGKQIDEVEFDKLLKDVDIEELKNRKPSELSGGQRQRVAIARALIKNPRIIMADEPTGALDSTTGEQVLETLKKLSNDRLVIVVSHDREFAEKYADRIITLVDGKVASDVSFKEKALAESLVKSENTVFIREGSKLSSTEKDALAEAVYECKKIEIVKNLNYREKEATGEIEHDTSNTQSLRKSKMKLSSSAYLGVKSLTVKPVRLVITIFIAALAFAVFAIFDTLANFSTASVLKNQLKTSLSKTVVTTAEYVVDGDDGDSYSIKLSDEVLSKLENETRGAVKGIYNLSDNTVGSVKQTVPISELSSSDVVVGKKYFANSIIGYIEFDVDEEISSNGRFKDFEYTLVYGEYPQIAYNNGFVVEESLYQVAISTYLAESIIFYLNGEPLNEKVIVEREDLIGATITLNQQSYKIVGLIDCGIIPEKYQTLRQTTPYNEKTKTLMDDYDAYINSGAQKCLFMPNGFLEIYNQVRQAADIFQIGNSSLTVTIKNKGSSKQVESYVFDSSDFNSDNIIFFNEEHEQSAGTVLKDDEILIHHLNLQDLFSVEISKVDSSEKRVYLRNLIAGMENGTAEENRAALKELLTELQLGTSVDSFETTIRQRFKLTGDSTNLDAKIVGVYFGVAPEKYTTSSRYKLMMNKNLMQSLSIYSGQGEYSKILFSGQSARLGVSVIANYLVSENGFALNWYNSSVLELIKNNEMVIRQIADLFLYVALALALFSIFMLYNYISTSISNKKRSVGILRALGAGGKDILFTFLTESLLISAFNGILAVIFAVVGTNFVNAYIATIMNISVKFALFGLRQVCIILIISLLTAILSSALPIFKITKKKPVELIRNS